jgi:hypothetical protein
MYGQHTQGTSVMALSGKETPGQPNNRRKGESSTRQPVARVEGYGGYTTKTTQAHNTTSMIERLVRKFIYETASWEEAEPVAREIIKTGAQGYEIALKSLSEMETTKGPAKLVAIHRWLLVTAHDYSVEVAFDALQEPKFSYLDLAPPSSDTP